MKNEYLPTLLATAILILGAAACTQEDDLATDENDGAGATVTETAEGTTAEMAAEPTTETGDSAADSGGETSWTISVGAFTLDDDTYVDTGVALTFTSSGECQTWSRTARGDAHDADSHPHYNAAANVSYDDNTTTFSWTEYGPELDQSSIEATCSRGVDGVTKTVDDNSYYQDKPNVHLRIVDVVEN